MLAYRQHLTIENPQHTVLSNLPLKAGQRVEVLILVEDAPNTDKPRQPLTSRKKLFAKQTLASTSSLEHLRAIRDGE